jgi:hypothetical protein
MHTLNTFHGDQLVCRAIRYPVSWTAILPLLKLKTWNLESTKVEVESGFRALSSGSVQFYRTKKQKKCVPFKPSLSQLLCCTPHQAVQIVTLPSREVFVLMHFRLMSLELVFLQRKLSLTITVPCLWRWRNIKYTCSLLF